ncbi:hypothetical protein [Schlesneria paludicola]|uniref:hypothetical protein n=1 Tax=Schlesneria paludicola TaxID=360056 RepID=UPI0012F82743|nr:hypothetical protein [Schlesneria paludicola]
MRATFFFIVASLSADVSVELMPNASIAVKYSEICRGYDQAMAIARGKNAPSSELRRIGEIRQEAFRELIVVGQRAAEEMVAADWAAISMAAESLFQRDECIRCAVRAIELDPQTREAYAPLIRSLLNSNRLGDAEAILVSAKKRFNDGSKWYGFHYFLFIKHRDQKHWVQAVPHLQVMLDAILLEGSNNAIEMRNALKYFSEYRIATQQACLDESGRRQLEVWILKCADAIDRKLNDDGAGTHDLAQCAALCEARCAIAKCSPEVDCDECIIAWAKVVFDGRWASHENASRLEQLYFRKYFESNAANVISWSKIAAGLSEVLSNHVAIENGVDKYAAKSTLKKLQEFARDRISKGPGGNDDAIP